MNVNENERIKVLHIANDYSGSTVYKNLDQAIDTLDVEQLVYTAIRSSSLIDKNKINFRSKDSKIIYSAILSTYTRINYKAKLNRILRDIEGKVDIAKASIIHAHTWYSDGGIAYELNKKHGIPYIVTVRNTDLNLFFKYMLHLREYGLNILTNAVKIVFISPVYLERLLNHAKIAIIKPEIEEKCVVIPNGIDSFWIENVKNRKEKVSDPVQLLYIGKFNKGKNVIRLLKAVVLLNKRGMSCHLHLVGGGGKDERRIFKIIKDNPYFSFHGKITDKETLVKIFTSSDLFTMPSHHETFGLVYIEALSQGIPVIYTNNEGIFGFYDHTIGEAVDSTKIDSIANGIRKIVSNYNSCSFNPVDIVSNHDWNNIADEYGQIYQLK